MLQKEEITKVLDLLEAAYPNPKSELNFTSPYELLVATILSAQSTDKQVNICTSRLFAKYNAAEQIAALAEDELFDYIKSCGLYKSKGRNIIAMSKMLLSEYNGEVPKTREALMRLNGVGRKTANVVLSNAFNIAAIAVDTHVFRVANRIGLADAKDVLKTELALMEAIPKARWSDSHHYLILHGRRVCSSRNPKCALCTLKAHCIWYNDKNAQGIKG